ncbi:YybH family protein [Microvirga rosea]|uniref:YybH family protein n=1 Tax=Microvirga rosea TaxID=2715425 RepID=UPI001D0A45D8|nr:SgcJ/EcaC family oxidoreductase [Microvirga rosea]MCB8820410.1 SgcJ/EcaC family oxidoreductase [Microvirga rosea]
MDTAAFTTRPEDEIRALIEGWRGAVLDRDPHRIGAYYAPDIEAFDAISRLRFSGLESYRRHWEECFAAGGAMIFEIRDLAITATKELAFAHFLNRCGQKGADDTEMAAWMRATLGYRKHDGRWLIVHEHISAPFDPETGEAMIHLLP